MHSFKNYRNLSISYSNPSLKHCPTCLCSPTASNQLQSSIYTNSRTNLSRNPSIRFKNTFEQPKQLFQESKHILDGSLINKVQYQNTVQKFRSTSPVQIRKARSASIKFNTKEYIEFHFPYLKTRQTQLASQRTIKYRKQQLKIGTKEIEYELPRQHPVIKANKLKSPIFIKKIKSDKNKKRNMTIQQQQLNDKLTIKQLSENIQQSEQYSKTIIKHNDKQKNNQISIKAINSNSKISNEEITSSKNQTKQPISKTKVAEKYPTVRSIKILKSGEKIQNNSESQYSESSGKNSTSLKLTESQGLIQKSQNIYTFNDVEKDIGMRLSSQLSLNYDYFIINDSTDRSLSSHVEL